MSFSPPQPTGSPRRRATRKTSCGRAQLVVVPGVASCRLEAGVEAPAELGEVGLEAVPAVAPGRVGVFDLDEPGGEE